MGTCSYVLTGTQTGMDETFGSTCHGAGRAQSRNASRRKLEYQEVGTAVVAAFCSCCNAVIVVCLLCSILCVYTWGGPLGINNELFY